MRSGGWTFIEYAIYGLPIGSKLSIVFYFFTD